MLIIRVPSTYAPERDYVLNVVLGEFLGLDFRSLPGAEGVFQISLADAPDGRRLNVADGLFKTPEECWLTPASLPHRPLARWAWHAGAGAPTLVDSQLPVLYGGHGGRRSLLEEDDDGITLGIDLFGGIFYQLTRYEEVAEPAGDEHGRYPASASLAYQEGFLERPLVNEYVELLGYAMRRLWPRLGLRRPVFKQRLSHDVDWPAHPHSSLPAVARSIVADVVTRRDRGLATARLRALRAHSRRRPTEDPYYTFEWIMDLSEKRGLRSAFYFMAGRTDPRFDGTYRLDEPWIGALIRRIHDRGHELGLHPSYGTFRDPAAIRSERDALVGACERLGVVQGAWGGRQHFLRWENPITWRAWEQASLGYDSSLGYPRNPGFRCGTCYEYPVFDLLGRRSLALRERPLVVMDLSVLEERNRDSIETARTLRERCRMFGGEFTLLWHNSRLASGRERALYSRLL